MSFDTHLGRIDKRKWESIKSNWYSYLSIIDPPGTAPNYEISDSILLREEINNVKDSGEFKCDLVEIRKDIFREGIFLLHKAANVTGVTYSSATNGFLSWSNSSAYQSSFFAVKSIFCFCGMTFPKINGIDYLVDIWPQTEPISNNQLKKGIQPIQKTKILKFKNLNHYQYWRIFQRLLTIMDISIWNDDLVELLKIINPLDFGKQRNSLHYQNNYWLLTDLFQKMYDDSFSEIKISDINISNFEVSVSNFSVVLSRIIFLLAFLLVNDINQNAPILNDEVALIVRSLRNFGCDSYLEI
ncbi:MAG TPA: hypothetical protein VHD35_14455 [Chitinophagaceae bacterium]|nr:hypothetical protein [Chitinophagaceae bacterium]